MRKLYILPRLDLVLRTTIPISYIIKDNPKKALINSLYTFGLLEVSEEVKHKGV